MFQLATRPTLSATKLPATAVFHRTFFGFFAKWNKRVIYPPPVSEFTTNNRLFPTYIEHASELSSIVNFRQPLLLNFTYPGVAKSNEVSQLVFDVLSKKELYPLDSTKFPVNLANIACDSEGGRELLQTYAVGTVPTLLLLKKQMPADQFVVKGEFKQQMLVEWLRAAVP